MMTIYLLFVCAPSNICSFIDSFIGEPYGDHLYIIMEYANGGDLRKEIKKRNLASNPFSELEVQTIILQCSLGLQHIHDVNIIHRDIKVRLNDYGTRFRINEIIAPSHFFASW